MIYTGTVYEFIMNIHFYTYTSTYEYPPQGIQYDYIALVERSTDRFTDRHADSDSDRNRQA